MILADILYGKERIKEKILLELIFSKPVQRLKHISQYGLPDKYYHLENFSRYEHSIGVLILLRRLGASLEEQIAGLLHDTPHYAFSHVADWVFSKGHKGKEDYHDEFTEKVVLNSEIPEILKSHEVDIYKILHNHSYLLLERPAPDLCADRLDYSLRELKHWLNPKAVPISIKGLINHQGEIIFSNPHAAFVYATNYLNLQSKHWGGKEAVIRYYIFSRILRDLVKCGMIIEEDFLGDERVLVEKIESVKDSDVQQILQQLSSKNFLKQYKRIGEIVYKKFRYVDPKFILNREIIKLSSFSKSYKKRLDKQRVVNEKGVLV